MYLFHLLLLFYYSLWWNYYIYFLYTVFLLSYVLLLYLLLYIIITRFVLRCYVLFIYAFFFMCNLYDCLVCLFVVYILYFFIYRFCLRDDFQKCWGGLSHPISPIPPTRILRKRRQDADAHLRQTPAQALQGAKNMGVGTYPTSRLKTRSRGCNRATGTFASSLDYAKACPAENYGQNIRIMVIMSMF